MHVTYPMLTIFKMSMIETREKTKITFNIQKTIKSNHFLSDSNQLVSKVQKLWEVEGGHYWRQLSPDS